MMATWWFCDLPQKCYQLPCLRGNHWVVSWPEGRRRQKPRGRESQRESFCFRGFSQSWDVKSFDFQFHVLLGPSWHQHIFVAIVIWIVFQKLRCPSYPKITCHIHPSKGISVRGVTFSGIYWQTATGARQAPGPFIAGRPFRPVVLLVSLSTSCTEEELVSVVVVLAGWLSAFRANNCIGQTWREAVGTWIEIFVEFWRLRRPHGWDIRDSDWVLYIHEDELSPKTENRGSLSTHTLSPVDGIMITCSVVRTRALVLAVIW